MISYGKQSINQDDIDAVVRVLKSKFLTQGSKVVEFEKEGLSKKNQQIFAALTSAYNGNILKDDTFKKCIIYDSKYEDLINKNYDLLL